LIDNFEQNWITTWSTGSTHVYMLLP